MPDTLTVGSTYRFQVTATKDALPWNLATATVYLYLVPPGGSPRQRTATVTDAAAGVAEYRATTADLDAPGYWHRAWEVIDGAVDIRSQPVWFNVVASP